MTQYHELLATVKNYCDITFEDTETDEKLSGIISRGAGYLQNIAGGPLLNFAEDKQAMALLLDYCRYARSNALEVFSTNFKAELIALRIAREVATYEAENPASL